MSHTAEAVFSRLPGRAPSAEQLARARIVAHRGQRDDITVFENTFAAFDPVVDAGVAAIEFDIRYTRDDEPVVVHDADLERVFNLPDVIANTPWKTLARRAPQLPHLADLVERYATRAHLMIELKTRGSARAEQRLADHLGTLTPVRDFHMLSLDTALFDGAAALPARCYLPVAKLNLATLHQWALAHDCAGLAGPYALMRARHIRELHGARTFVGSGFVALSAILMREIGRGIEWIFTNEPLRLQAALDDARARRC
ncbi:glycerophosphodiester phosphodiesterase [Salinisphaera aquimarina]|uniref:Glycerophosphodiester phosphodiesterase n=1 Tax=Salinisphaera aquimarina TaxID=2094031 RepID=A0ABV7EJR6_9GAMM